MSIGSTSQPRLLRAVPPPPASYFRVGRDHKPLQSLVSESRGDFSGLIFDGWSHESQGDLRQAARQRGIETILDTHGFELSSATGSEGDKIRGLGWAGSELPHTPSELARDTDSMVEAIADEVGAKDYSAVLTPSHFLESAADAWLPTDIALAQRLRVHLDARGRHDTLIYYSLTTRSKVLCDSTARASIAAKLERAPIDALWLRIHPFGATSAGPLALRRYIEAAGDLHRLDIPLVAERSGTVGLALLAFGAVGGIESGITLGERFDAGRLLRPVTDEDEERGGFVPAPRVYLAPIGAFVSRKQAEQLFAHRQLKSALACRDSDCCRHGAADTVVDPRRHFIIRRNTEVAHIGAPPAPLRPGVYLEDVLRPASDIAMRAARIESQLEPTRDRLEGWRQTLGAIHQEGPITSFAVTPEGKRVSPRLRAGA